MKHIRAFPNETEGSDHARAVLLSCGCEDCRALALSMPRGVDFLRQLDALRDALREAVANLNPTEGSPSPQAVRKTYGLLRAALVPLEP